MTTRQRVSITWGALRGREDTGNVLGIGMTSASLGSHAPARHARVPGVHSWSRRLRRGVKSVNIALLRCARTSKIHSHDHMKFDLHATGDAVGPSGRPGRTLQGYEKCFSRFLHAAGSLCVAWLSTLVSESCRLGVYMPGLRGMATVFSLSTQSAVRLGAAARSP